MILDRVLSRESWKATLDLKGILRIKGHICVRRVRDFFRKIHKKAHCSRNSIHLDAVKIFLNL